MNRIRTYISIILMVVLISQNAFAFETPVNGRAVPKDVYVEPYAETRTTYRYAPWLKQFAISSKYEKENRLPGAEGCQQILKINVAPSDSSVMYFGCDTSPLWKSVNGGKSWRIINGPFYGKWCRTIFIHPDNPDIVYLLVQNKDGLYRTKDGGYSWELLRRDTLDTYNTYGNDVIAMDEAKNVYIAMSGGIWRLDAGTDKLENISPQFSDAVGAASCAFTGLYVSLDGKTIYATTQYSEKAAVTGGLHKSTDGGKTWSLLDAENEIWDIATLAFHPENPDEIYATMNIRNADGSIKAKFQLYKSADGGITFEPINQLDRLQEKDAYKTEGEGYLTNTQLLFGPKNKDGVYPLYTNVSQSCWNVRVSYDYGQTIIPLFTSESTYNSYLDTWYASGEPGKKYTGWWPQAIFVDQTVPEGRVYYGGAGPMLWEGKTGEVTRIASGFNAHSATDIAFDNEGKMVVCGMDVGVTIQDKDTPSYTSDTVDEMTFSRLPNMKYSRTVLIDPNDSKHMFFWKGKSNGTPNEWGITEVNLDQEIKGTVHPDTKILKEEIDAFWADGCPADTLNPSVMMYDPNNDQRIITSNFISEDNGKTWQKNPYYIFDVSKTNPDIMIAGSGKSTTMALMRTEDGGKTWQEVCKPGFGGIKACQFDAGNEDYIYLMSLYYFKRVNIKTGEAESLNSLFPVPVFGTFAQNPNDTEHIIILNALGYSSQDNINPIVMESCDNLRTVHTVPGFAASYIHSILGFSETTSEVFIGGHSGTWAYDYKAYGRYMEEKISVKYNDNDISFRTQPEIKQGITMVPIRDIAEMLHATVGYEDGVITVNKQGDTIVVEIGKEIATMNGKKVDMELPPYLNPSGYTMVPLKFIAEALGIQSGWSNEKQTVYLKD